MRRKPSRAGLSLLELLVVLAALVAVAGVAVMSSARVTSQAQLDATRAVLRELRDTFVGGASGPGYLSDVGRAYDDAPPAIDPDYRRAMTFLFTKPGDPSVTTFDPVTKRGWRGPYLKAAPLDGWGRPIELRIPDASEVTPSTEEEAKRRAQLVSGGPDRTIETPPGAAAVGDDVVVFLEVGP